jgi:DNA-binding transcriptional MerR regulator
MMTIGEVATRAGIHTSAIRYYERSGLLTLPSRTAGRRVYQTEVLHQLTIISVYKTLGFTLGEIKLLLNDFPKDKKASECFNQLARTKIEQMENIIVKATAVKKTLIDIIKCRCADLESCAQRMAASPRRRSNLELTGSPSLQKSDQDGPPRAREREPEMSGNGAEFRRKTKTNVTVFGSSDSRARR